MSKSNRDFHFNQPKARNYRALAAECERQAELAFEEPQFRAMQRKLARSYVALAEAEDWLNGAAMPERADHSPREAA